MSYMKYKPGFYTSGWEEKELKKRIENRQAAMRDAEQLKARAEKLKAQKAERLAKEAEAKKLAEQAQEKAGEELLTANTTPTDNLPEAGV